MCRFYLDEILPGDTFNLSASLLARLATPLKPVMDNMYLDTHFFFIPNRLVWDNWEKFRSAQDNPGDSTDYIIPMFEEASALNVGTLADYFGIPTGVANLKFSQLPFRCYNLIYNEWFRDQNLQNSAFINKADGNAHLESNYPLRRRGKRHDYFTSCLPWPQKGDSVQLPMTGVAPIQDRGGADVFSMGFYNAAGSPITAAGSVLGIGTQSASSGQLRYSVAGTPITGGDAFVSLEANLSEVLVLLRLMICASLFSCSVCLSVMLAVVLVILKYCSLIGALLRPISVYSVPSILADLLTLSM